MRTGVGTIANGGAALLYDARRVMRSMGVVCEVEAKPKYAAAAALMACSQTS